MSHHVLAANQTKNDHIQLYLVIMKVKKNVLHRGQINKGRVGSSVHNFLQEQNIDCKKRRFQKFCSLKRTTLKTFKGELLLNYKKTFRLKSLIARSFLGSILQEHKSPFFSAIIYYFYSGIFIFGIDPVSRSLFEKLIWKTYYQLV